MSTAKIAWIGDSRLSAPLCAHLAASGIKPTVFGVPAVASTRFRELGLQLASSIYEAVDNASVIFSMWSADSDPCIDKVSGNSVVVDLCPSTPLRATALAHEAAAKGVFYLDAAILGGMNSARNARLNVYAGGQSAAYAKIRPLLKLFSHDLHYMGGAGSGVHGRLARQLHIAVAIAGLTQSMRYSQNADIPFETFVQTVPQIPLIGSVSLRNFSEYIARGSFSAEEVGTLGAFYRDLCVAIESMQSSAVSLPVFQKTLELFENAVDRGYSHLGLHAIAKDYV